MGVSGGFAAMGLMSMGSAYAQGQNAKTQADFTASQYSINKQIAEEQGKEALSAGDIDASKANLQGKQEIAKQRVASAATGADVNSGSALELQSDTGWQARSNAVTLKNNAWRQAWGYKVQAIDYGMQGELAELAGKNQATNSLLTGGMNAISYGVQAGSSYRKYNG